MVKSPYEILGVPEGAGMDEIKRAYRKKAKEYHPDLHPDDPKANEKMQEVNQAYDMLCNPEKYRQTQARPGGSPYGNPGGYAGYGGYGSAGQQYNRSWQYTWHTGTDGQDPFAAWQNMWGGAQYQQQQPQRVFHPLRSVLRVVAFILLFRFLFSILGFGFFPFFFFF